jgi:serine/threonine protein kinase
MAVCRPQFAQTYLVCVFAMFCLYERLFVLYCKGNDVTMREDNPDLPEDDTLTWRQGPEAPLPYFYEVQGPGDVPAVVKVLAAARYHPHTLDALMQASLPHVVPVLAHHRWGSVAYIMMPRMAGNLRAALPCDFQPSVFEQITRGVAALHDSGWVHGEIKPENILLDAAGQPYLADFDTVTAIHAPMQHGVSPAYCAPEIILRQPVTPQTDIYALGVMLWEWLAGYHPFVGQRLTQVLHSHLHAPLPLLEGAAARYNDAIQRATRKDPALRWARADDLLSDMM